MAAVARAVLRKSEPRLPSFVFFKAVRKPPVIQGAHDCPERALGRGKPDKVRRQSIRQIAGNRRLSAEHRLPHETDGPGGDLSCVGRTPRLALDARRRRRIVSV